MDHAIGRASVGTLAAARKYTNSVVRLVDSTWPDEAFVQRTALINATVPLVFNVPLISPRVLP